MLAPPANKGISKLNRDLFRKTVNLVALRLPASACGKAMKKLRGDSRASRPILDYPRLRSVVEDPDNNTALSAENTAIKRLVLLNPEVVNAADKVPADVEEFIKREGGELVPYKLDLDYDYWTADQVLRSILPDEMEVPGAFEAVGHIAHVNLRDEHIPYKQIIGQVLLDKNRNIRTVVNKTDTIDHTFRFFKMEVLCGEDNLMAELKESNCRFRLDFSRVYWNSRLQGEHERIVKKFQRGQLICDIFGGVGPYAVPAAKNNGCVVFANDLNPASYEYLCENVKLNKVEHLVKPYNLDGRDFIRQSLADLNDVKVWEELRSKMPVPKAPRNSKAPPTEGQELSTVNGMTASVAKKVATPSPAPSPLDPKSGFRWFDHYVMNLPATAIEFLDAFRGLFRTHKTSISRSKLPIIHCHCFSRDPDFKTDVIKRVETVIGALLGDNLIEVYDVRNVAPNKEMLCISFRLPEEVAFAEVESDRLKRRADDGNPEIGTQKKLKTDDAQNR